MAAGKKDEKDDKAAQPDAAADEAKKKKKKLFMFIGLAVLLVLISVGATFFIVSKMMGSKHSSDDEASAESSEAAETVVAPAIYYPMKPNFTVNYDVNGRQRFLQAELTLMYRDPEVLKTLELHMPAVRNGLVMLLSSQVFEELQTAEGKEKLRAAALKIVQDTIAKEEAAGAAKAEESEEDKDKEKSAEHKAAPNVEQLLFTQFVMQ